MPMKRPAALTKGRPSSCDDLHGLVDALKPWVVKANFVSYPNLRGIKHKDVPKMKLYLDHLKRIQNVHRTWNFSMKTIDSALNSLNQEGGPYYQSFPSKHGRKGLRFFSQISLSQRFGFQPNHVEVPYHGRLPQGHQELHLVSEVEAPSWKSSKDLRLQVMFRHIAQEALNCRTWLPKDLV